MPKKETGGQQLSPEQAATAAMVAEAKARGLAPTGPGRLVEVVHQERLETALGDKMTMHLGHEKNRAVVDRESTNVRNGTRSKTVISDAAGEGRIDVPRDRKETFEAQIVKKRQYRLSDVDKMVCKVDHHRSRRKLSAGSPTKSWPR